MTGAAITLGVMNRRSTCREHHQETFNLLAGALIVRSVMATVFSR